MIYFAIKVSQSLQVPIGIIGCNKGGSTVQSWMSRQALNQHGQVWLDEHQAEIEALDYEAYKIAMKTAPQMNMGKPFEDKVSDDLLYGLSIDQQRTLLKDMPVPEGPVVHYDNRPGCYFDHMLKTIAGVALRGVIWYQGESEVFHPECYKEIFSDMIDEWRSLWAETLPFHCVQLAPFQTWMACEGTDFVAIRQLQETLAAEKEGVYLVSASDAGMRYDIHPKKKAPIGMRLALSALKHTYGEDLKAQAPRGISAYTEGSDVVIEMAGDMSELTLAGDHIQSLELVGQGYLGDQFLAYDKTDVVIEGCYIRIRNANPGGSRVKGVRLAWRDYYEVNLYGSGLPAMPFNLPVEGAKQS